jgi:hypothetical protein
MLWVTRSGVKVGRVGCIWLIRRFIDPDAEVRYVTDAEALELVEHEHATAFHVRGVGFVHASGLTPFEAILREFKLPDQHPALTLMGQLVNAADTDNQLYQLPEGPGIRYIVEGMRLVYSTDEEIVAAGAVIFDALYAQCVAKRDRAGTATTSAG